MPICNVYLLRRGVCVVALFLWIPSASARGQGVGVEAQVYPAGGIFVARADIDQHWSVFAGLNVTRRRDFGEHDDERGYGWGAGAGWKSRAPGSGFEFGGRLDVWRLNIDWADFGSGGSIGTTRVTVLQPTVRVDRIWNRGDGGWQFRTGAALGVELNVNTAGEPVGQGLILLVGIAVLFSI